MIKAVTQLVLIGCWIFLWVVGLLTIAEGYHGFTNIDTNWAQMAFGMCVLLFGDYKLDRIVDEKDKQKL